MDIGQIQTEIRAQTLDGWLFFDHHERDPLAYRVLGFRPARHVTRRWYYFIPREGDPIGLVHRIEAGMLEALPGSRIEYSSWHEQRQGLARLLRGARRIAMQYSPECAVPYVSMVDAGTMELVRGLAVEVVSSAELIQTFESCWDRNTLESHLEAGRRVDTVRREAFEHIAGCTRAGRTISELEVKDFILRRFRESGLVTDHGPIVGANENSGNPHYEPDAAHSREIAAGDFVLLDLWAKLDRPGAAYYDITWTGFCGDHPGERIREIFEVVTAARDRAIDRVKEAVAAGRPIRGFEVDDAARDYIRERGYGSRFIHRTGHSIGAEDVHGNGANMDNLETHDDRRIVPGACFSIEPGIYLKEFGVRSEVNMFVGENDSRVTGEIQRDIVII